MKNIIIGILVIAVIGLAVIGLSNKQQSELAEAPTQEEEAVMTEDNTEVEQNQMISLNVYFNNLNNDPNLIDCQVVYPVLRQVPYTQAVGMAALNELIAGPTSSDTANGYRSSIPSNSQINSLSISNGVAYVDVDATFFQTGGSCGTASAVSSLRETLEQFSTVQEVEITVDGMDFSDYAQNLV